jgi:hypothetical protein
MRGGAILHSAALHIIGNFESVPSMSRPIRVKRFEWSLPDFFFFRSAKPPLSTPFHPHSWLGDSRSVPVGCSRFSPLGLPARENF